ncbi:hypothetical protein Tco_0692730, partial [Tanacetum coccineum]
MVRNGADDPYIRPLNHYGDQIFQKYDDDDDDDDQKYAEQLQLEEALEFSSA